MNFILILLQLIPVIPGIIRAVESIHGTTPGKGADKLKTAIELINVVAPAVEKSIKEQPENRSKLESIISIAVAAMNAAGTMNNQLINSTALSDG